MHTFDRAHSAYRHKNRGHYLTVVSCDNSGASAAVWVCFLQFEFHNHKITQKLRYGKTALKNGRKVNQVMRFFYTFVRIRRKI